MKIATEVRAKRILKSLSGYQAYHQGQNLPALAPEEMAENLIGIYENPPPYDEPIFIFDNGIAYFDNSFHFVDFSKIDKIIYEEINEFISLKMLDSKLCKFRVSGRNGKFLDATEFVRFLDRVVADTHGRTSQ